MRGPAAPAQTRYNQNIRTPTAESTTNAQPLPPPSPHRRPLATLPGTSNAPAYIRLDSLDAVVRELFAPNERARRNYQLYLATDPYDVARHLLRNLHDRPGPIVLATEASLCSSLPLPLGEGRGEGPPALPGEATIEEDDDPL